MCRHMDYALDIGISTTTFQAVTDQGRETMKLHEVLVHYLHRYSGIHCSSLVCVMVEPGGVAGYAAMQVIQPEGNAYRYIMSEVVRVFA